MSSLGCYFRHAIGVWIIFLVLVWPQGSGSVCLPSNNKHLHLFAEGLPPGCPSYPWLNATGRTESIGNLYSWKVPLNYWLACLGQTLPNSSAVWQRQLRGVAWTLSEALSPWEKIPIRTCRPLLECIYFPLHFSGFIPRSLGKLLREPLSQELMSGLPLENST